jgi:hypothetical protein
MEALATHDTSALSRALSSHLPPLGITASAISRLSVGTRRAPQLEVVARLSPEFGSTKTQVLPMSSLGLDQALEHRAAVVLMPLFFNRQPLGLGGL